MILPLFGGPGSWRSLASRAAVRVRRAADALLGRTGTPRRAKPDPASLVRGVRAALTAQTRQRMARLIARAGRAPRLPPPERDSADQGPGA